MSVLRYNNACFLLLAIVFSVWITVDFTLGGKILPNPIPALLIALYLLFYFNGSYRVCSRIYVLRVLLIVFFSLMLTAEPLLYFHERITGAIQLVYSVIFFTLLVEVYQNTNLKRFKSLFILLYVVFISLLILEFLGVLKGFFDYVRSILYSRSLYESTVRDLVQYGAVRPNSFMREPAHVALFFSLLTLLVSLSVRFGLFFLLLAFLFSMLVIRSPIAFFMIPAYLLINYGLNSAVGIKRLLVYILAITLSFLLVAIVFIYFEDRVHNILDGVDFSAASRFIGPPIVTFNVLLDYPFFGIGPTADSLSYGYVYDAFFNLGFDYQLRFFSDEVIAKRVTNSFFLNFIYFGLLGGCCFLFVLYLYVRTYLGFMGAVVFLVLFLGLGFCIGGFVTPMFWALAFLLFASVSVFQSKGIV